MTTYHFYDRETSEEFFVEEETLELAKQVAREYFENPKYLGKVDEYTANMLGYDTY